MARETCRTQNAESSWVGFHRPQLCLYDLTVGRSHTFMSAGFLTTLLWGACRAKSQESWQHAIFERPDTEFARESSEIDFLQLIFGAFYRGCIVGIICWCIEPLPQVILWPVLDAMDVIIFHWTFRPQNWWLNNHQHFCLHVVTDSLAVRALQNHSCFDI